MSSYSGGVTHHTYNFECLAGLPCANAMRFIMKLLISIAILSLVVDNVHPQKSSKPAMSDITIALQKFTAHFTYRSHLIKEKTENMLYSPISIAETLGMVMTGARGTTYDKIKDALILDSKRAYSQGNIDNLFRKIKNKIFKNEARPNTSDNATVISANKAYIQNTFDIVPEYVTTLRKSYAADIEPTDFSDSVVAAERINSWINNQTGGMIPDLIQSSDLSADTRLLLVNALYFNGFWEKKMNPEGKMPFFNHAGHHKMAEFIGVKMGAPLTRDGGFSTIFLEYNSTIDTYMVINKLATQTAWDNFFSYNNLVKYFTSRIMKKPLRKRKVHISMPKFDFEMMTDLTEVLSDMNMREMFDMNAANFSGISTAEHLYLSKIKHKAKISVNEAGTKAAAATGAIFLARSVARDHRVIIDQPFVFSIVRNGHVLFFGAVKDLS